MADEKETWEEEIKRDIVSSVKVTAACRIAARKLNLYGREKEDFIDYCSERKKQNIKTSNTEIINDFLKIYYPEVEGVKFENIAVLDTMPVDSIKITGRFRDYASKLGKYGKLIINYPVLAELLRHGVIPPIVLPKGKVLHVADVVSKKISASPDIVDVFKKEIVKVINQEIPKPQITIDNIEIVPHNPKRIREMKDEVNRNMSKKWQDFIFDTPYTDKSVIATMFDENVSLLLAADQHFDKNFKFWKRILNNPNFKLLSQKTLGTKEETQK